MDKNTKINQQKKRIAVVTMGVKLGDEMRGYTRFRFLSDLLVRHGFEVDLVTSSFQHWDKTQRNKQKSCYQNLPYTIVFIDEPGYEKNLDFKRIKSHKIAAKNIKSYFSNHKEKYDLIYAEIPPNDVARACATYASEQNIPFVVDINDLWPEAMRMVIDIPVLSKLMFYPFSRDAKYVYNRISGAIGTSDEYALRPAEDRTEDYLHQTVYVGNDLAAFDSGVSLFAREINKGIHEIWVTYAGTLGASYDLSTLVKAGALLKDEHPTLRIKILGDGPDRKTLEDLSFKLQSPVDFLGYMDYGHMAAFLSMSDITINSLVGSAVQSVVTKIGDYLAAGKPMINTGSSLEFRSKVTSDAFGLNVEAENPVLLAEAIKTLITDSVLCSKMGDKGRIIAETEFDQPHAYLKIVKMIKDLLEQSQ